MELLAVVISCVALGVSVLAAWWTRAQAHSAREMAAIERERRGEEVAAQVQAQAEARRAAVTVRLSPPERNAGRQLLLSNAGPAEAHEVGVRFVRPLSGDGGRDGAFDAIEAQSLTLARGEGRRLRLTHDSDTATRYEVRLSWRDLTGEHSELVVIDHSI